MKLTLEIEDWETVGFEFAHTLPISMVVVLTFTGEEISCILRDSTGTEHDGMLRMQYFA
jgi:hypothetical protein